MKNLDLRQSAKSLDLRQFAEVMVALLAQKGIACRLGENNGRIGIIYEEAGIKASTDVTLLWQKYGADYDVAELADVLYKAITSEVQKKKAEMPNPMPEPQVQPQISRPQMKTQPGRVTQQPMSDDMSGKMQIKCFGQNGAPLFEGSFNSPEEAKAAIAGFMKNVLNADDASVTEFMKEFDARTRDAEAPKQQVKKPEPGDTARLVKKMFNMNDDEANDFLANLLKADLERKSVCNKPATAGEPCQSTSKYTKKDVAEAEKVAKGFIKSLFGIDLPEDMHSTAYNMTADDKTGDKTDACRGCGKDCTCGSYPKLSKQPPKQPKQPKQNFDFFRKLFAQPAKTSADPSELLENVYPAFITDEMLDGYDIEKVLHLPVFDMHLVYYVDDALAHKYDGLLSDKLPFLSLKAFEIFEVTEDEINDAALANIKEKVRLKKTSFVERNAFLITSDVSGIVSCASILCDGLLYNTATALGHDKVFVLELQPNEVIVLGADEPIGELIGGTLDYTLKDVDKTVGKLLSTTVFCYDKRVNTLYPCSFNN